MTAVLEAALALASAGLRVLPLRAGRKTPWRGTHGVLEATTDPDQIRGWWVARPDSNVGVATGGLLDVIDLDGPDGLRAAEAATDWPTPVGISATPRGRHLWIPASGDRNSTGIFPGVDYRGAGGYVVAPPSQLADAPEPYRWVEALDLEALRGAGDVHMG